MAKRILKILLCEHYKNFKVCLAMDKEPWGDTERNLKDKVSLILLIENITIERVMHQRKNYQEFLRVIFRSFSYII